VLHDVRGEQHGRAEQGEIANQLFKDLPKDPWNNNYIYINPGRKNPSSYDLYSAGPDRAPDTPDDDWGN